MYLASVVADSVFSISFLEVNLDLLGAFDEPHGAWSLHGVEEERNLLSAFLFLGAEIKVDCSLQGIETDTSFFSPVAVICFGLGVSFLLPIVL